MDRCDDFVQLLSQRLDGPLTGGEERTLEAHLAVCPACRALGSQLAAIHAAFPEMEEVSAPEGFAQGVMERIQASEAAKKRVVPLFRRPQVKALAGLAACAVLCVGLYRAGMLTGERTAPTDNGAGVSAVLDGEEQGETDEMEEKSSVLFSMPQPDEPAAAQEDGDRSPATGVAPRSGEGAGSAGALPPEDTTAGITATAAPPPIYYRSSRYETVPMQVAGQEVDAILTLDQLPEGTDQILGAQAEWLTDEENRAFCVITGEQMEALMELAEEQGQDLTSAATNRISPEELCALVLAGGDAQSAEENGPNTP